MGQTKAPKIALTNPQVKEFNPARQTSEVKILDLRQDVVPLVHDLRVLKQEYLVCLYLDPENVLLKKETINVKSLDQVLLRPRKIFYPATKLNADRIIIVHNHPSGNPEPGNKDIQVVEKTVQAGEAIGIPILDFVIISLEGEFSFHEKLTQRRGGSSYVTDGVQNTLFDLLEVEKSIYGITAQRIPETYIHIPQVKKNHFQLHNRRYIGNKYKLVDWIFSILGRECKGKSFADIFAGTGVIGAVATKHFDEVILNDFLYSNYAIYKAFFGTGGWSHSKINSIIRDYNNINGEDLDDNYFSLNFGGKYFSTNSAKIIGFVRENIEENRNKLTEREYDMLIASLIYSVDKIANTVGHYDAYFKKETIYDNFFMRPIDPIKVRGVSVFREDTNQLAKRIQTDVVYIDPPYNSRQYSRFYHILETLTKWDKPRLYGVALKPEPENMSDYCRVSAKKRFAELVRNIRARYIVVSYNNTYNPKSSSSLNKITLDQIQDILSKRGQTKIFEKDYRHFNAGNTDFNNHKEYLFVTDTSYEQEN